MVKAELGTKRTCPSCAARFYDLLKNPIVCPKCGVSFVAATLLPSKAELPAAPKPVKKVVVEAEETPDVELVSLEDVEEPDTDDETAAIEDVDLGEDAEVEGGEEEDDTFLVEEEEDGDNVSGLIDGGQGGKEEEEEP